MDGEQLLTREEIEPQMQKALLNLVSLKTEKAIAISEKREASKKVANLEKEIDLLKRKEQTEENKLMNFVRMLSAQNCANESMDGSSATDHYHLIRQMENVW